MATAQRQGIETYKLHVGTIGWSYTFWKGNFYPPKLSSKQFLAYYAKHFNTVEVDNTFYRIPTQQSVVSWSNQTPESFLFSLKFPQVITHIKMLENCQEETSVFLNRAALLKGKFGVLLLQFPPAFGNEHLPILRSYLENLPREYRYAVEVRNKKLLNDHFYSILRDNKVAFVWVDNPIMPQTSEVTSNFLYIRLEGDRKKVTGTLGKIEANKEQESKAWAQKIEPYLDKGTEVFVYFGKYFSGFPPSDITHLLSNLNNK